MGGLFSCKRREEMQEQLLAPDSQSKEGLWKHWPRKRVHEESYVPNLGFKFDPGLRISTPKTPDILCQNAGCDDIKCSGQCQSLAPRA